MKFQILKASIIYRLFTSAIQKNQPIWNQAVNKTNPVGLGMMQERKMQKTFQGSIMIFSF